MIDSRNPDYTYTPVHPGRPRYHYAPAGLDMTPMVTLITPCYNTDPAELRETIHSILNQSFQQWEWIIVNDGTSRPETLALLDELRRKDVRIRVFDHNHNRGPSAARNTGFRLAATDLVVMIDADDILEPTAVEKWYWALLSCPFYGFVDAFSVNFGARQYLWPRGANRGRDNIYENQIVHLSMVRRVLWEKVGGFDEDNRAGCEDWEFWVAAAAVGEWGYTLPEYLFWYRTRPVHTDRWPNLSPQGMARFRDQHLAHKFPNLYAGYFPEIAHLRDSLNPFEMPPDALPTLNRLAKPTGIQRLLLLLPWLEIGGADKCNLDIIRQIKPRGWEVTVCTTLESDNPWLPEITRLTPDVFCLPNFLRLPDYPRFIHYVIQSRQVDVVLISNSMLSYQLLPYLRSRCPHVTFVDLNHIEEVHWNSGGHPRSGVGYQELLDLNIVTSQHLKNWMVSRGAESQRIEVCTTNIDEKQWDPSKHSKQIARQQLDLDGNRVVILFPARISPQKRPQMVADILEELARRQHLDFVCIVAGDGPELPSLMSYVQQLRLEEYFRFLGSVSQQQILALQAAADILLLPSAWEGIALVIFEAMAMETVPVAADVGGQRELVTPECGFLIPHGQDEIERYVAVLSDLIRSPGKRQAMAKACRQRIEQHFTLDQMGDRMAALLERAQWLHEHEPRPAVTPGLGLELATFAIEYTRLDREAARWWRDSQQLARMESQASERMSIEGFSAAVQPIAQIVETYEWRLNSPLQVSIQFGRVMLRTARQAFLHPRQFLGRVRRWQRKMIAGVRNQLPSP